MPKLHCSSFLWSRTAGPKIMMLNHDVFQSSISFGASALPVFMLDTCHSVKCQLIYRSYLKTQCVTIDDFPSVVVYGEVSFSGDESLFHRKKKVYNLNFTDFKYGSNVFSYFSFGSCVDALSRDATCIKRRLHEVVLTCDTCNSCVWEWYVGICLQIWRVLFSVL